MSQSLSLAAFAFSLALMPAAQAQRIAPGLWEQAATVKMAGGQMEAALAEAQKELAQLPPEQRKMAQDMMARQGMGAGGASQTTTRICITKAQAERDELARPEDGCRNDSIQRSGNTVRVKFSCGARGNGEAVYTLASEKSYRGRTLFNAMVDGRPERMDMALSGKWISADCGSVKPLQ
jgi:hypothetical protein